LGKISHQPLSYPTVSILIAKLLFWKWQATIKLANTSKL